jgi:hypothetical protein
MEAIGKLPSGYCCNAKEMIQPDDPRASVEECEVIDHTADAIKWTIALAVHHPVSRWFYESSLADDNAKRFMRGEDGRQNSFIRIAFETDGPLFAKYTIAAQDYPSVRCTPFEAKKCCSSMRWLASSSILSASSSLSHR